MLGFCEEVGVMSLRQCGAVVIGVVMCASGVLIAGAENAGATPVRDRQALSKAKSDLAAQAFSLQGLIVQLNYGGYTMAEAQYGAEHAGANWNHEAVLSAKQNLTSRAYSSKGLVQRLEVAKFTVSQAKYGVAECGANWNTQAYLSAKQDLQAVKYSKSGLVRQLESSGFTAAQASYGANKAF